MICHGRESSCLAAFLCNKLARPVSNKSKVNIHPIATVVYKKAHVMKKNAASTTWIIYSLSSFLLHPTYSYLSVYSRWSLRARENSRWRGGTFPEEMHKVPEPGFHSEPGEQ